MAWVAAYAGTYVAVIRGQGSSPAWWYLAVLAVGAAPLALAAAGRWSRPALTAGAVLLALAALAGVLSVGLLLLPGVVAAVAADASAPSPPPRVHTPAA
jgi:hypothetical protein